MYFRSRNPKSDDQKLIKIGTEIFAVSPKKVQRIIDHSFEVLVVCDKNDEVVGFLSYRLRINHMILVDYVMLRHDLQGSGIARSLLPAFEKYIQNKGITVLYGLVDRENTQGLESLKRLGFEVKGEVLSNYIIEKKLTRQNSIPESPLPKHSLPNSYLKRLTPAPRLRKR
ncbi:GNAT family N-acetyltransferase [Alkalihalobacillus sp. CinArs1]|uniref:GNAT family N-acetyltransferase n=1 Tax=Alkalihalobacillus sp. CinArs1 TaxID=2995314 RepID=UPI0022DD6ED8|nr:GNAT family N-acetyltransferase [Alkalihalobacillus sp. CinArs1]